MKSKSSLNHLFQACSALLPVLGLDFWISTILSTLYVFLSYVTLVHYCTTSIFTTVIYFITSEFKILPYKDDWLSKIQCFVLQPFWLVPTWMSLDVYEKSLLVEASW